MEGLDPGYNLHGKPPYQCTLSPELQDKALKELEEKPEWRARDVEALRHAVAHIPDLNSPVSDAFLLRFLRAKKFDHEKSRELLRSYFLVRYRQKILFQGVIPMKCDALGESFMGFLPGVDFLGARVLFVDLSAWRSENASARDLLQVLLLHLEMEIASEVNGMSVLIDLRGLSMHKVVAHLKTAQLKSLVACLQGCFPMRLRAIHFVQESAFLDLLISLIKPLLSEKLRRRIHFHGNQTESLLHHMDQEILPEKLGGDKSPGFDEKFDYRLRSSDPYFRELALFGYIAPPKDDDKDAEKKTSALRSFLSGYKKVCIDGLNQ